MKTTLTGFLVVVALCLSFLLAGCQKGAEGGDQINDDSTIDSTDVPNDNTTQAPPIDDRAPPK